MCTYININILLICLFFSKAVFAEDIPVIVIAPGKTVQSKSIVGSDVVVIDSKKLEQSNEFFLGDVLNKNLNGINLPININAHLASNALIGLPPVT